MPMYELTAGLADVEAPPPPEMQACIALLAGNARPRRPGSSGLIAGSVPIPEFFSPESLAAIEAEAQAAAA